MSLNFKGMQVSASQLEVCGGPWGMWIWLQAPQTLILMALGEPFN